MEVRERRAELEARGATVLVVSFEAARRTGGYCRRYGIPFPCLVDEDRRVYHAYGLGRASWLRTLTPRALGPYLRHAFTLRGLPARSADQDVRQRGGDVVVGSDGLIRLMHASDDPADRPSVDELLAALA